jgi:hypothetical protein
MAMPPSSVGPKVICSGAPSGKRCRRDANGQRDPPRVSVTPPYPEEDARRRSPRLQTLAMVRSNFPQELPLLLAAGGFHLASRHGDLSQKEFGWIFGTEISVVVLVFWTRKEPFLEEGGIDNEGESMPKTARVIPPACRSRRPAKTSQPGRAPSCPSPCALKKSML